jgi:hypothetical protein
LAWPDQEIGVIDAEFACDCCGHIVLPPFRYTAAFIENVLI